MIPEDNGPRRPSPTRRPGEEFRLRLDPETARLVRKEAAELGLMPSVLIGAWVRERARHESQKLSA